MSENSIARKVRRPISGLFELTYRCNLNCVYCYCKGSENEGQELSTAEVKTILKDLQREGCLQLAFTGGEPFLRKDFSEIYLFAKRSGFFSDYFYERSSAYKGKNRFITKISPALHRYNIERCYQETYEKITQTKGAFDQAISVIKTLAGTNIPVYIKVTILRDNMSEIGKIKEIVRDIFGENRVKFKYDFILLPRLNRDMTPCEYRLGFNELKDKLRSDPDIFKIWKKTIKAEHSLSKSREYKYQCSAWLTRFIINPYGMLKFCQFTDKFSTDLRNASFREGFYNGFSKILSDKFSSHTKCQDCDLRPICLYCPARALIETGDEESPVLYFCEFAKELKKNTKCLSQIA